MNRILVTGGAGFIGSNFVNYWSKNYTEDYLVIVDSLTYAGNISSIEDAIEKRNCLFSETCINNTAEILLILNQHKINAIVHFAAESHVDRSIEGPDKFIETNIVGTHSLLRAAKSIWLDGSCPEKGNRFHHVSTDEVYGSLNDGDPAFCESTPYAPNSPYSASKAAADFLVRSYHHTYGLNTTISNCSNNYGPMHHPEKLIPLVITNLLRGKTIPVYGSGLNVRDWLHVEDHCVGIDLVFNKGVSGETYNIGGNCEVRNIDIVKTICELLDNKIACSEDFKSKFPLCPAALDMECASLIEFVRDRAGHDYRYAINTSYIQKELGYQPSTSFEAGLEKTVDWYLNNMEWWEPLVL